MRRRPQMVSERCTVVGPAFHIFRVAAHLGEVALGAVPRKNQNRAGLPLLLIVFFSLALVLSLAFTLWRRRRRLAETSTVNKFPTYANAVPHSQMTMPIFTPRPPPPTITPTPTPKIAPPYNRSFLRKRTMAAKLITPERHQCDGPSNTGWTNRPSTSCRDGYSSQSSSPSSSCGST